MCFSINSSHGHEFNKENFHQMLRAKNFEGAKLEAFKCEKKYQTSKKLLKIVETLMDRDTVAGSQAFDRAVQIADEIDAPGAKEEAYQTIIRKLIAQERGKQAVKVTLNMNPGKYENVKVSVYRYLLENLTEDGHLLKAINTASKLDHKYSHIGYMQIVETLAQNGKTKTALKVINRVFDENRDSEGTNFLNPQQEINEALITLGLNEKRGKAK